MKIAYKSQPLKTTSVFAPGLLSILLLFHLGCERRSPIIEFVLPDGFRGAFIVYTNQVDGVDLPFAANTYTCVIPSSGVLKVRKDGPFYNWHRTRARYENGTILPVLSHSEHIASGTVAFWNGASEVNMLYDFIGTQEEADVFFAETAAGPVHPGRVVHHEPARK